MASIRKSLERDFQNWLIKNQPVKLKNIKGKISVLFSEYRLIKPMFILAQNDMRFENIISKTIGKIDLIIRFRGKNYASEIKYMPFAAENFWGALKCMAYSVYYNWQRDLENVEKVNPAMFLPLKIIKLEHKIIAGKLGIILFGIEKKDDIWEIHAVNY
ncbi:MAG: hypothetical protein AABY22_14000 [Nanoarchaeota archaeon]